MTFKISYEHMKKFLRYFFQGLFYTVPIALTIYLTIEAVIFVDNLIPFDVPGLGIVVIVGLVSLIGYLGSTFLAKQVFKIFDGLVEKVPFIKIIYTSIRDLLSAFVGQEKRFNKPVLVRISGSSEIQKLGFVTQSSLLELGIEEGKVAVYLPHSYNFSGNLFIVPMEYVTPIEASSSDVMKFIVSGGIADLEDIDKKNP